MVKVDKGADQKAIIDILKANEGTTKKVVDVNASKKVQEDATALAIAVKGAPKPPTDDKKLAFKKAGEEVTATLGPKIDGTKKPLGALDSNKITVDKVNNGIKDDITGKKNSIGGAVEGKNQKKPSEKTETAFAPPKTPELPANPELGKKGAIVNDTANAIALLKKAEQKKQADAASGSGLA